MTPKMFHACGAGFDTIEEWQEHVYGVAGDHSAAPICHGRPRDEKAGGPPSTPEASASLLRPSRGLSGDATSRSGRVSSRPLGRPRKYPDDTARKAAYRERQQHRASGEVK